MGSEEKEPLKPVYNEKEFFAQKPKPFLRRYSNLKKRPELNQETPIQGINGHKRFLSEKKFNPFHKQNIANYNN